MAQHCFKEALDRHRLTTIVKGVEIRGNRRVPTDRIRSELQTRSGDPIDLSMVSRDIRTLYSLGYFDDVQFETQSTRDGSIIATQPVPPNSVNVIFVVDEGPQQ